MTDVIAYIDGFNLYNGLRQKYGRRYLWLDLEALCQSLLLPGQNLRAVKYFTAAVRKQPDSLKRQQAFWNALGVRCPRVTTYTGRFQEKTSRCRSCGQSWLSYEEKETDCHIVAEIVEDAASQAFDTALLVSADSDLCPAIWAARRLHPACRFVAAFPPARESGRLRRTVDASFTIARTKLRASLLPDKVPGPGGRVFSRPTSWK